MLRAERHVDADSVRNVSVHYEQEQDPTHSVPFLLAPRSLCRRGSPRRQHASSTPAKADAQGAATAPHAPRTSGCALGARHGMRARDHSCRVETASALVARGRTGRATCEGANDQRADGLDDACVSPFFLLFFAGCETERAQALHCCAAASVLASLVVPARTTAGILVTLVVCCCVTSRRFSLHHR
jgi:hypothetical protein